MHVLKYVRSFFGGMVGLVLYYWACVLAAVFKVFFCCIKHFVVVGFKIFDQFVVDNNCVGSENR